MNYVEEKDTTVILSSFRIAHWSKKSLIKFEKLIGHSRSTMVVQEFAKNKLPMAYMDEMYSF